MCFEKEAHFCCHSLISVDSIGVAAGPNVRFCLLKAVCECIEKETVAIWHYNQLVKRPVILHSFGSSLFDQFKTDHARLGRQLVVLDVTSDIRVPVFVAASIDPLTNTLVFGSGAHLQPERAITSALYECNLMLLHTLNETGNRKTEDMAFGILPVQDHHQSALEDKPMDAMHDEAVSGLESVDAIITCLADRDLEVLVKDMSRPGIDARVIRVMIPGLRPWYRRLGPGRLYHSPVATGDLQVPNLEAHMNEVSIRF